MRDASTQHTLPQKKKWPTFAKVSCLVVALGGALAAIGVVSAVAMFTGAFGEPRDAAHQFFDEVRRGDYDSAYKKTATTFRDRITLDTWDTMRTDPLIVEIRDSDDATFNHIKIHNDRGCMSGTLSPRGGPVSVDVTWEDERWKVADVRRQRCTE